MTYIEKLRASKDKAVAAYHEFMLHTRRGKNGLFCFFEGKDNAYYVPRIKQITTNYHPIRCNGRERVLKVHELIKGQNVYDKYKKAFFIDRDFNLLLAPQTPPIFETPCYSIENFYVSIEVFKEILKNEFQLSEISADFETSVRLYTERQVEFHEVTTLLNAWYACLIDIKNTTGQKVGATLKEKLPNGFVQFSLINVVSNYDLEKLKTTFPKALAVTETALTAKLATFSSCEQHKIFRGKYEMQFLLDFLKLLFQDSMTSKTHIKHKLKYGFNIQTSGNALFVSHEQALNLFSGYAETPQALLDYLKMVSI